MFLKFSDVFGPIRNHSDPFGPIRTCSDSHLRLDVFGNKGFGTIPTVNSELFVCDFFQFFRWFWRVYGVFRTSRQVFICFLTFLTTLVMYQLSLVICRHTRLWTPNRPKNQLKTSNKVREQTSELSEPSIRFRTHPNASEQVRMGQDTSENFRKLT